MSTTSKNFALQNDLLTELYPACQAVINTDDKKAILGHIFAGFYANGVYNFDHWDKDNIDSCVQMDELKFLGIVTDIINKLTVRSQFTSFIIEDINPISSCGRELTVAVRGRP